MTTITELKPKDCVRLIKAEYEVNRNNESKKVADAGGVYTVVNVIGDVVKLKSGSMSLWTSLDNVELLETYIDPKELITASQEEIYAQFNGHPVSIWEITQKLGQPVGVVRGALNVLTRQGLLEEVELDVWKKRDDESTDRNPKQTEENTGTHPEGAGDLLALSGERDEDGQVPAQAQTPTSPGDRGENSFNQLSMVSRAEDLNHILPEVRVENPQSLLGEIINLATVAKSSQVAGNSLSQMETEANQLWEMRSQLEEQLLLCLGKIYLGGEWKKSHKTWTQYFIATFSHWQKAHRYRMKDAGEIFSQFLQLSPQGDGSSNAIPLPTSEGQLRELKKLPAPERVTVWQQVVQEHGEAPPRTAVEAVVKKYKAERQKAPTLQAQAKTEAEIRAQFNCRELDPVQIIYTGRSRGLESDVTPQLDGLVGIVQKLGVASGLVYVPILNMTIRCSPNQMVKVPLPDSSRMVCDRIKALVIKNDLELTPVMHAALEALSRQTDYKEDDLWLLKQIEQRLYSPT